MIILFIIILLSLNIHAHDEIDYHPFQQALAQLYVQKPHLLKPRHEDETPQKINYALLNKILNYGSIGVPLAYFSYGSINNCIDYYNTYHQFQESSINQLLVKIFPGLFINSPRIIGLFLQEVELLLQAYLLKIMLKLIIFCFS